ncbi:MAG: ABC transporter family substrate-binding protein [Streptomyces sp.]
MVQVRRSRMLLAVILALSLVAAACGGDDEDTEGTSGEGTTEVQQGGTIAFAADQEPTGFNNITSKDNLLHLRHLMRHIWPFAYLSKPDFSLEATPVMAGPVEVVSEDPFTLEWKIAEEAIWDDDTPVSSDDFEWVYLSCNGKVDPGEPTVQDEESGETVTGMDCASTSGYDQITEFEKVDGKTFRATFAEPYVEFEGLFGDPLPPSHLGKQQPGGWNTGFDASPLASAGPYRLKEYVKGDHFTLERNPKWWGPKPKLDTLVFRELPDSSGHPDALRNDEVQLIYPQPQTDLLEQLKTVPGAKVEVNFGPTYEHMDFNFNNELLAIKEVRQAFAYGMDRDRYVRTLMSTFSDDAARLDSYVFVSNSEYYEPKGQEYAKVDTAKAMAAMEKAGFTKGSDGIYAKGADKASFRLRVKSPNPLREQLEELIKDDMKKVGIDVRIENFGDPDTIGGVGSKGDFDLLIFAWIGTPFQVSGTQQTFASDSDSNFGKYANEEFDAGIKEASRILDKDDRAQKLNELDEVLWEDVPTIPLFQKPSGILSYSDKYANIIDNTTTEGPFWNSINWGLKAAAQ